MVDEAAEEIEEWIKLFGDRKMRSSMFDSIVDRLVGKGKVAVEPLIRALESEDNRIRDGAVRALGKLKDPRAIEPLIRLLRDPDEWVAGMAADMLGRMGGARAIEELINVVGNPRHWRTDKAINSLIDNVCDEAIVPVENAALEKRISYECANRILDGIRERLSEIPPDKGVVVSTKRPSDIPRQVVRVR